MKKILLPLLFVGLCFAQEREKANSPAVQLQETMIQCQSLEQLELKYEHELDALIREGLEKDADLMAIELEYFEKKKALLKSLLDAKAETITALKEAMGKE